MCYLLYGGLIATLLVFAHATLSDYALSVSSGAADWSVIAVGWGMLLPLWPLLLLVAAVSSAATYFALRTRGR